ncbi:hypothetical protein [Glycomyces tarimensis]
MRKSTFVIATVAGLAAASAAAAPAMAQNSGVNAGDHSVLNLDASSALHWQICGQNIFTQSIGQVCDNRDHIGHGPQSQVNAGDSSVGNVDLSDLAHWQICGQNIGVSPSLDQQCLNYDHMPAWAQ